MSLAILDNSAAVRKKITAGSNTEFWLGKFRRDYDFRRPFGSIIELRGTALAGGETDILVRPLKEDLPPGTILTFPSGAITLLAGANKGAKEIKNVTVPVAAYGVGEVANTSNIEQVITLSADLVAGDRQIIVNATDELIEKGRILTFNNGIKFEVTKDCHFEAGSQEIFGELVASSVGSLTGTLVATGGTAIIPEYELVCSADSIQGQNNAQSLTDFLFKDGQNANKDVVTRDRTFTITGKEIESDFGYRRILEQTLGGIESGNEKAYFIAVSGYKGRQVGALCCIGNESLNAQNNQRNTLNASIEVDGAIVEYDYPHVRVA